MKKIQLLLLMLSCMFVSKAQIVYQDVNPDIVGQAWNLSILGTTFADWGGGNAFATNPYDLANQRCMVIPGSGDGAAILNQGDMIAPTSSWNGDAWNLGTVTDKYLGVRIGTVGNYRYAWIKISRTAAGVMTIQSYAYQNTLNTPIAAGDMGGGGGPVAPVSAFTATPLNGQTNITNISFTDQTTNAPTTWAWSFTPNNVTYQNGTNAASQNPVVKFTAAGTYTVALTTTNAGGNNTHTKNNYITITNPPAPDAAFTASNLSPATGVSTVTFTDQSINAPTSRQWTITPNTVTYQNGTSAASQNPQVIFNADGMYTVKLKVMNAFGADSITKTNYITATPPQAPDAAFTANPLNGVSNATNISFTDLSLYSPTSWSWTFTPNNVAYQNGTAATSQNPVVKFTQAGTYSVKLIATNNLGMDSAVQTNYITILNQPPAANFNVNTTNGNATQTVFNFNDLSTNGPTSWAWTFTPNTVTYVNGTNANSQHPQVVFDNPGNYSVKLLTSNDGGSDSITKVSYIAVAPAVRAPEADFTADVTTAIKNQTIVSLLDQSEYIPTSWKWSITPNTFVYYNNGNSTLQNPKILFTAAGNYTIKLRATNDLGADSIIKTGYITVVNGTTGIKEQASANVLNVFPNPAGNYLNFELRQDVKIQAVTIISAEGRIAATYNSPDATIDISHLAKGVYFLKMEFKNETIAEYRKFSKL